MFAVVVVVGSSTAVVTLCPSRFAVLFRLPFPLATGSFSLSLARSLAYHAPHGRCQPREDGAVHCGPVEAHDAEEEEGGERRR